MISKQIYASVLLMILGLGIMGGGAYLNSYVVKQLDKGIKDKLVIDGPNDPDYKNWLSNTDPGDLPKYKSYYFYNLTNLGEVLSGGKPSFEEVGPFVYRQYDVKFDVSFKNDLVYYRTWTYYVFQENMSAASETAKIININPAYLGVLGKAGSEKNLVVAMSAEGFATVLNSLVTKFVPGVIASAFPTVLDGMINTISTNVLAIVNASTTAQTINGTLNSLADSPLYTDFNDAAIDYFNNTSWQTDIANALGAQNAPPMKGISEWLGVNLGFTPEAVSRILFGNPSLHLPGWLYMPHNGTGILGFLQAYNSTNHDVLAAGYNVTTTQLDVLAGYLQYMFNLVVPTIINAKYGVTPFRYAQYLVYGQWANGTLIPTGIDVNQDGHTPDGFEVATIYGNGTVIPTEIPLKTVIQLMNSSNPYGLTNGSTNQGIYVWYGAALGNTTLQNLLATMFSLNSNQLSAILNWIGVFKDNLVPAILVQQYHSMGVNTVNDLAFLQWGSLFAGASVAVLDPNAGLPGVPEFAAWAQNNGVPTRFNATMSKAILNGTFAFTNATYLGAFLLYVSTGDFTHVKAMWGLNNTEAVALAGYVNYFMQTFVVNATLKPMFDQLQSGLFVEKTVKDWLWQGTDPLLALLGVPSSMNLFKNTTSLTQAKATEKFNGFNTGKKDITKINQYVMWNNLTQIEGIWKETVPVKGTDATQFAPGVTKDQILEAFVSDLLRPVTFVYDKNIDLYGVTLLRFVLAQSVLANSTANPNNAKYYMNVEGLANMTSATGLPLYLSKPHFLDAAKFLSNDINIPAPDRNKHDTFIDVEPITGTVMRAYKRLQINFLIPGNSINMIFTNSSVKNKYIPLLWVQENGEIDSSTANSFKQAVYQTQAMAKNSLIIGLIVGIIALLAGASWTTFIVRKK